MIIKKLGLQAYEPVFKAMQAFTVNRSTKTEDELWVVEHSSVFTQGKAGKPEHLLASTSIPVIQTDRGGQITYHGPGQIVIYTLIDFSRRQISVRELVTRIESAIIKVLQQYSIRANSDPAKPGVYVDGKKIASLGLRISNHAVYHGLSLNLNMDLTPFHLINPCGYQGLEMIQVADLITPCPHFDEVADKLIHELMIFL